MRKIILLVVVVCAPACAGDAGLPVAPHVQPAFGAVPVDEPPQMVSVATPQPPPQERSLLKLVRLPFQVIGTVLDLFGAGVTGTVDLATAPIEPTVGLVTGTLDKAADKTIAAGDRLAETVP